MKAIRAFSILGPIDLKNMGRDPLMRWFFLFPVAITLATRLIVPFMAQIIQGQFGFDIVPYYPLLQSFIVMTLPLIIGVVIGFLLLDQKDDQTLKALQVTPLSLNGYLVYRISLPMLISLGVTVFFLPLTGLTETNAWELAVVGTAAAPLAPLSALFFGSVAQNKVQGFALNKGMGIILVPPLIAYFVDSGWQLLFGIVPTYWPVKLFWVIESGGSNAWIYLLLGLLYQGLLIKLALGYFHQVVSRE
jgi:fluoroquinolone transport system permease protein